MKITSHLNPYPTYKDSGVEWLGDVPAHWDVRRIKTLFREKDERSDDRHGELLSLTRSRGLIPQTEASNRIASIEDLSNYKVCRPGDLVMNRMQAWSGMFAATSLEGLISPDYCVFGLVCESEVKYFEHLFKTSLLVGQFAQKSKGIGSGFNRLYTVDFGSIASIVPPLPEQSAIVRFLDHADRSFRRYIRAKQKLIELLEEQKQAIIHQAVTGQIDVRTGRRYPAYKHSGVDWLGEVPKHWEMVRNGRLFGQRNEIGFPELPILEVSLRTGVRIRDFENSDRKQVMSDRNMYKRAARGDIAYNMMRMWQGAVGLTPVDGLVSPAYVVAKPMPGTEPRYYDALFRTRRYMAEVDRFSRGIVKDRNRLYWEDFKQMSAPCPPTDEQAQIARAIDHNIAIIDKRKHRIEGQISFLREYRTRFFADVVTGKLDVRKAAAELPEDDVQDDADESEAEYTSEHPTM